MADHPIFTESIRRIRVLLGETGLDSLQQQVLERLVHSSGDPGLAPLLRFSPGACECGLEALRQGASVLTETAMATAAISPMARRTLDTPVRCLLDWAPPQSPEGSTRSAAAMQRCCAQQRGISLGGPLLKCRQMRGGAAERARRACRACSRLGRHFVRRA